MRPPLAGVAQPAPVTKEQRVPPWVFARAVPPRIRPTTDVRHRRAGGGAVHSSAPVARQTAGAFRVVEPASGRAGSLEGNQ
ncbi:hypothetical protein [Tsukamurella spumae]|uniref:Uncharacterized protein n=1 Tax=Tsukamurella spumae TaxID=44753 RepID=A0A846X6T1_9ACTN|nr:hypothetical protein [Tsukamurella spumae]NKY19480.1 hypothetical protein [Tsukamurella spumae]